jgi:hypothetical protein
MPGLAFPVKTKNSGVWTCDIRVGKKSTLGAVEVHKKSALPDVEINLQHNLCFKNLAGAEGLEPSHAGIKIQCLNQLGDAPTLVVDQNFAIETA